MNLHVPPNCRPLVGPGNTNHALDGRLRRPQSLQCFVIDMEEHLDATRSAGVAVQLPPQRKTKNPAAGVGLGVRFFLYPDAKCEPYGRRFGSARNNKANRFSSRVTIPLIYMARGARSSAELPLATAPPIHRGAGRPAILDFPVNTFTGSLGYLTEATRPTCNAGTRVNPEAVLLNSKPPSYDALILSMQDQMMRSIWRITRAAEDAEDALQESLTIIWKRRARIERHPCRRALILRICVHCACDVLRARLRRGWREKALANLDALHVNDCPIGEKLQTQELRDDIRRALVRLPSRQATAVVMRHVLELSYEEIGSALGCSVTTARVHVNRACKRLSRLLAHLAPSHPAESKK
jgi:RNA polymerase sigma factor (sigma-70 family)